MTEPENQAEALDEKAFHAAVDALASEGYTAGVQKYAEIAIREYLAALPEAPAVPVDVCASEGCGKTAAVHFIRGDVGSYYCADCYSSIHAIDANLCDGGMQWGRPQRVARGWFQNAHSQRVTYGLQSSQPVKAHPDDIAVDRFAVAMKEKLAKKRAEGRGGWERKDECSAELLSEMLRNHIEKGDPVDVGNLAMMLHQRSERII